MEWRIYFSPIFKWWKLIRLAAIVAGVSTLIATIGQRPVYTSTTTLMIGRSLSDPNPSSNQFYLEQDLARFYADMGTREPVRRAAREALGLASLPEYYVAALPNTQIIEIRVRDADPIRAAAVATELANQLILRTPTTGEGNDQERASFVENQLTRLQTDITATEEEIQTLQTQLGGLVGAREISDTERQISALDDKLRTLQSTYASMISGTPQGATNTLALLEPADTPRRADGPNRVLGVLLGMALGAALAVVAAYVIEFLDRRVAGVHEVNRTLAWPVLGEVETVAQGVAPEGHVLESPRSSFADSFRILQANLELLGVGQKIKSLLVTGPSVSDGKSTVALNLAMTWATPERMVVLVEADVRRPARDHPDRRGLSDLLLEGGSATDFLISPYRRQLYILPAGQAGRETPGLFQTPALAKIFSDLKAVADVIIIDGPPTFVADAMPLSTRVDGVIGVVRIGKSSLDGIKEMKRMVESIGVPALGVVVNGVTRRPSYYSAYYRRPGAVEIPDSAEEVIDAMRHWARGLPRQVADRLRRLRPHRKPVVADPPAAASADTKGVRPT
jgi:capsular exopolysaccharide synthesis family protein